MKKSEGYAGSPYIPRQPVHGYNCYCDICCKKAAEKRGNWYDSAHTKEMNQIMRGKK